MVRRVFSQSVYQLWLSKNQYIVWIAIHTTYMCVKVVKTERLFQFGSIIFHQLFDIMCMAATVDFWQARLPKWLAHRALNGTTTTMLFFVKSRQNISLVILTPSWPPQPCKDDGQWTNCLKVRALRYSHLYILLVHRAIARALGLLVMFYFGDFLIYIHKKHKVHSLVAAKTMYIALL